MLGVDINKIVVNLLEDVDFDDVTVEDIADLVETAVEEEIKSFMDSNRILCKGCGYQMDNDDLDFIGTGPYVY